MDAVMVQLSGEKHWTICGRQSGQGRVDETYTNQTMRNGDVMYLALLANIHYTFSEAGFVRGNGHAAAVVYATACLHCK